MYEALTALIPVLKTDNFGEWIVDRETRPAEAVDLWQGQKTTAR